MAKLTLEVKCCDICQAYLAPLSACNFCGGEFCARHVATGRMQQGASDKPFDLVLCDNCARKLQLSA